MTIELITTEEYAMLVSIQKEHPILTYQNRGYDTVDKSKFTDADKEAHHRVATLLSTRITGYSEFNNFTLDSVGDVLIRFQYNYGADDPNGHSFIGVGYLYIVRLYKGFDALPNKLK